MSRNSCSNSSTPEVALIIQLVFLLIGAFLGTWCVNYDLSHMFHQTIGLFWAFCLNVITGGQAITLAIIIKVLMLLHIIKG